MLIVALLISNITRVIFAFLAGFLLGFARTSPINLDHETVNRYIGHQVIITATISDTPEQKNSQTRLKLNSAHLDYSTKELNCQIFVFLAGNYRDISRSDQITLRATLQSGFGNYVAAIFKPTILALNKPDPPDYFTNIRTSFSAHLRDIFHHSVMAELALGFLVGEKTLPNALKNELRIVGLSHIVVASGFSLSIIINCAKKSLQKISRFASYYSALIILVIFLAITGLSPSLLRASLVSGLQLFAAYYNRKFHPGRLLMYTAAISTLVNPIILTDLAWQLSFASYAGIMLLVPLLKSYYYGNKAVNMVSEIIIVTISAQLCCLPISLYYFGQFSVIGLLANILVTPVISAVMLLSVLVGIFPNNVASIIAVPDYLILNYQTFIIGQLASIRWAMFECEKNQILMFVLYLPIIVLAFALKRRTKHSFKPVLALDKSPKYGKIYIC